MSVACPRINNEPLSPSLLGNEQETNVFNRRFKKPDGPSLHQIANKTPLSDVGCAGKLDPRNDRPVRAELPCQQRQKKDEAYAAKTHPDKNEPS